MPLARIARMMSGKHRKPVPPAAVPGARALADEDGVIAATTTPAPHAAEVVSAPAPVTRRKRRARFVF